LLILRQPNGEGVGERAGRRFDRQRLDSRRVGQAVGMLVRCKPGFDFAL
jgi:hypothetical protein